MEAKSMYMLPDVMCQVIQTIYQTVIEVGNQVWERPVRLEDLAGGH
jgi:hypothetical protein